MKLFFQRFSRKGLICAHRGARSIAPENTMFALEQARICGADLWETDVQLTADGELVLFHDDTMERTTDIVSSAQFKGRDSYPLRQFSYQELRQLDAGSWFVASDPYGTIAAGEVGQRDLQKIPGQKILSCREALDYCREHQFSVNLELKNQQNQSLGDVVVDKVLALIDQTASADLVIISSFNHDYLHRIRQQSSIIATAALVEGSHPEKLGEYLKKLGCDAYHPHWSLADGDLIEDLNRVGIEVSVWTVNDAVEGERFRTAGAFFICTDWPQRFVGP